MSGSCVIFADRMVLGVLDQPGALAEPVTATTDTLPQQVDAYERILIADALLVHDGNVAATADHLGVPKKTLYDKLKKYQLPTGSGDR